MKPLLARSAPPPPPSGRRGPGGGGHGAGSAHPSFAADLSSRWVHPACPARILLWPRPSSTSTPSPFPGSDERMSDAPPPPMIPPPPAPRAVVRVVLLGYMTAGKSTVGQALARRLEWRILDFGVESEQRQGHRNGAPVRGGA